MAISHDTTSAISVSGSGTSSNTFSHTVNADTSEIIFVEAIAVGNNINSATYNGTSLTQLTTVQQGTDNVLHVFYGVDVATGANNVVVSKPTNGIIVAAAVSYKSNSATLAVGTPSTGTDGVNNATHSSSISISNSGWAIGFIREDTGRSFTAGASTTTRITNVGNGVHSIDSGGATSGTHNFAGTYSGNCKEGFITVELYETAAATTVHRFLTMGVGI
jgi:hypothetical protein